MGEKFNAGRLGDYTITQGSDGGTEVLLGPPFKFDKSNIEDWKKILKRGAFAHHELRTGPAGARLFRTP